ncbi:hypothetical protein [Psychroserpens sp.]|uniref:hypothetical protein n=1 Tax=Psychroserpens sp. TaxID=2020870 RepID=UPI001B29C688|nr:hypothetical protein [Psychroserpens sp.]MBO6606700.1 hypothetical protein [Psychroserpens sp.]MBO6632019.1 hypothetical protein [Psychroserpens sp.]MBO6653404.1 hypothetical protein [Psychroserpens sp.]MBO6680569.1 hypothetical protein [Psychroserpens sp.]MBO6750473.1 hypothetical protein [Psychroserpens sp.]
MKKTHLISFILLLAISRGFSQIPVETYRKEIQELSSKKEINTYWNKLTKIDQEVLVNATDLKTADSISISNMIRTVLVFEIHGMEAYNPNGVLPILNLAHNYIGKSQLAYWPILVKCAKLGGAIESFGGKYPAYQLESVSLTFYNYSLFNQEPKYPKLIERLQDIKTDNTIDALLNALEHQNKLRALNEVSVLNEWYLQSATDRIDEKTFSFVIMSDNNVYTKSYRRIQKLELVDSNSEAKIYKVENGPFGWKYVYGNDGSLRLIDDADNILIQYTLAN